MDKEPFSKYKILKNKLNYQHKGISVKYVIAFDLIGLIFNIHNQLKSVGFFFLKASLKPLEKENKATLFSIGKFGRKDYYEIVNFVRSQHEESYLYDFSKSSNIFFFQPLNILKSLKETYYVKNHLGFKSYLILAAKLTYYLNTIDELHRRNPSCSKYYAFSSVHPLEAMLTLFFKQKNICTFSLQHGLYFVFKKKVLLDGLVYDNLVSDFHYCWGQYTKDEFVNYGINKDALLVGGYPRRVVRRSRPKTLKKTKCLIFLARQQFHQTNLSLIQLLTAEDFNNVEFYFKLHPSLDWPQYSTLIRDFFNFQLIPDSLTITELLVEPIYGWAISVNSAAYYEAYINFLPCLRFNDGTFEDSANIYDDVFYNLKELKEKYRNIPNNGLALENYFKEADLKLQYVIGFGINKYGTSTKENF